MFELDKIVRPNIRSLTPYSSARDEFQGKEGIFLDANENPFGTLNRYPDPYQRELKRAISRIKNIPEENIFLGNGSDEIIDLCFRIFCTPGSDKALTFYPTYGMYEVAASVNDIEIIKIHLNDDFQININDITPWLPDNNLKLILICSPNNPSGNCIRTETMEKIISGFKGIVLVDEAYIDFASAPSLKDSVAKYPNLIVMQTFSKAFGMASARVGMAFADQGIIKYLNKMKPPYNISTINQKAVLHRLRSTEMFKEQVSSIINERERVASELKKLSLIKRVYPSDANFLLVKVNDPNVIYNYLVDRKIIVRNRSSVVEGCIRITIGTKAENNKLLKTLKAYKI